jgi:hypothetical protein
MAQKAWLESFTVNNGDKSNAKTILDWYTLTTANMAENPARLIGLDDNAKVLFKYIIAGLVISNPAASDADLTKIINKLKAHFIGLKPEEQENELAIFDLIVKANEYSSKDVFFMEPKNPEEKFINNLPDLKDHMGDQTLSKINFYECIGIKRTLVSANPIKPAAFIQSLLQKVTAKELEELNKLKDIFEMEPMNVKYNFKYKTRRALMIVKIVLVIIKHLIHNIDLYLETAPVYKSLKEKTESFLDFILLFKVNYYTLLNSQEMAPPQDLFHGFNKYIRNLVVNHEFSVAIDVRKKAVLKILDMLKWFFGKLEVILDHSQISEIKTEECLYDLFDLIDTETIKLDHDYPLRTIHFRRDFVIKDIKSSVSIEFYKIASSLWFDIDKEYCYPNKIPLSLFLGILADVTKLEVFYNVMEFELGQAFVQKHEEFKKIRAKLDKDIKCDAKYEPPPLKIKNYSIDEKASYTNSVLNYLYYFRKNLDDAYLFFSQKNFSNNSIINDLRKDADTYLKSADNAANDIYTIFGINVTLDQLIEKKYFTKDNVKSFVWTEGSLNRYMNLLSSDGAKVEYKYSEENIGSNKLSDVLKYIVSVWMGYEYRKRTAQDDPMTGFNPF